MAKDLGIKAFLLSITSLTLTSLTTAAPGGISGSWSLFGDIGTTLVNTGQAITMYEIATAPDLAFFIAIWIATGAITLKFVDLIWSVMTQRINLGSSDSYSVSHDSGSGTLEKIIAGALSFIGAQYIGMLIGPILGSAMLLLGAMLAITIAIIFYWFLIASGESLFGGSDSDSSDSSNSNSGNPEDSNNSQIQALEGQLESLQNEIADLKDKEDGTKSKEEKDGDPDDISDEIGMELKELEDIVSKLEQIEEEIETVLGEYKRAEKRDVKKHKGEEKELQEIQSLESNIFSDLKTYLQQVQQFKSNSQGIPEGWREKDDGAISEELESQVAQMRELEDVFKVEKEVRENEKQLKQDLTAIHQELGQLSHEIEEIEVLEKELQDEEMKAEKIAQEYNDESDWEEIKQEEEETEQVVQEIKKVLEKKKQLDQEVKEELDQLNEERQQSREEVEQIQQILSELREEEEVLTALESIYQDMQSQTHYNMNPGEKAVVEHIDQLIDLIENMEGHGQELLQSLE